MIEDLIKVAKRENNTKRSYLYVNPIQGKHVPVSPKLSLKLFSLLARKLEQHYPDETLLVIGFAETATAIGSAIAYKAKNVKYYMNTTREDIFGAEYLFFTESHSHATEQRLVINGLEEHLDKVDRIVFAEDEVTTGNTIEKLVNVLLKRFPDKVKKFGIVSILNSMPEERITQLESRNILCDFLHKIPEQYRIEEIEKYDFEPLETEMVKTSNRSGKYIELDNYWNSRVICKTEVLKRKSTEFVDSVMKAVQISEECAKVLVLGTEELMFPGMLLGKYIEEKYPETEVKFHATTRSPIEVSSAEEYPLHRRTPLESLYEKDRKTFIYNLDRYDLVCIITDAVKLNPAGVHSLVGALEKLGNSNITFIKWGESENEEQLFKG